VKLRCGRFELSLERPLVMGVVNVTPDSFSDGGQFLAPADAIERACAMVGEGAALVDLGAESSRPGAAPVSEAEELRRLLPVLEGLRRLAVPISVDTRRPAVMRAALEAGASMINDIEALGAAGALDAVAASDCAVCLMHKKGEPATMQQDPRYADVVSEVRDHLGRRIAACEAAGIARERIVADPGFGFGKTVDHNLTLLKRLPELGALGVPLVAGWSRKASLGRITGRASGERLAGSLAAALLALVGGARILRVHDVKETVDTVLVWDAWRKA
jgi:dihydropteroate synthase